MTTSLLPAEIHEKWIHAFEWWYLSGKLDRVIKLLHDGISPSAKNSRFLAAILAKKARPQSGKRAGLYRFEQSIIDSTIEDLRNHGLSREEIREKLISKELVDERLFSLAALHQRMDGKKSSYIDAHRTSIEDFSELYNKHTSPTTDTQREATDASANVRDRADMIIGIHVNDHIFPK